jgi:hypothetical protein
MRGRTKYTHLLDQDTSRLTGGSISVALSAPPPPHAMGSLSSSYTSSSSSSSYNNNSSTNYASSTTATAGIFAPVANQAHKSFTMKRPTNSMNQHDEPPPQSVTSFKHKGTKIDLNTPTICF